MVLIASVHLIAEIDGQIINRPTGLANCGAAGQIELMVISCYPSSSPNPILL